MKIWLFNPYGPIHTESWRDYCFTMMGEALSNAGHDVVWWTSNFSHHFKKYRSDGWLDLDVNEKFIVRLVPTTGYHKNIGLGRILRDAVFAYRAYHRSKITAPPDLIIYSESPLTLGYAGQKVAKFHNKPVIFHQMDLWPELFEKVFPDAIQSIIHLLMLPIYRNRKHIYRQLDGVIALAKPYLDVPLREAPTLRAKPHEIIYNGIDVKNFRNLMNNSDIIKGLVPPKKEGDIWAVFAGSLGPSYDILTVLKAAKNVNNDLPNLKIIIAGDGPLKVQISEYVNNGRNSNLYYLGKLEPEKLCSLYGMCDIGLCTYTRGSNVEMPDKIYDYTAAGMPVINSLTGEVKNVICDNEIGLQYEGENVDDFVIALEKLVTNDSLRKAMAHNSFQIGMRYDQHVQYAKLVELVKKFNAVVL